ncbi:PfkB family carbohydrate kinase [Metabacillus bambusae]|uniref:Carbohydrate kinase PfkB domain-containing protein n=1 Tax=Metabacillus bambusae TaxID=2795218 RepID=A0ABS3MYU4_9BACI|nr:PfkB family carbohydrate kinase [Metabacillus bambusae]MBO1511123.1 hypothetical protein [Metabacillus bambusae]
MDLKSGTQPCDYLAQVCPYITFAIFSGGDLSGKECEELITKAHNLGTRNVLDTRGEEGALFSDTHNLYEQAIVETEVLDTLGAGDTFVAIFLKEYLLNPDPKQAMALAAAAAANTCKRFGAFGYGKKKTIRDVPFFK